MKTYPFASSSEVKSMWCIHSRSYLKWLALCFMFVLCLLNSNQTLAQQYTANFSTAPVLYAGSWPGYNTHATVNLGGVDYDISISQVTNWSHSSNGGESNSGSITAIGGGDVNVLIKRKDNQRFQFYGVWSRYTNYSGYANKDLRVSYSGSSEPQSVYGGNSTVTVSKNVNVTSVSLYFGGLDRVYLDNLIVGPAIASLPTLTTSAATKVNSTFATVGGNVTNDGGGTITERGIVWATTQNPTTANSKQSMGSGTGSFSGVISSLNVNTTYYARAYAINSAGTAYGPQVSFTTLSTAKVPTVWNGPRITFTKANNADFTQEVNQDRITDRTWITRKVNEGIFNIKQEIGHNRSISPINTEWAFGTLDNYANLSYDKWVDFAWYNAGGPPSLVGKEAVLHLIEEDIYIGIKFLSWTSGDWMGSNGGGGFSYERTTPGSSKTKILYLTSTTAGASATAFKSYLENNDYEVTIKDLSIVTDTDLGATDVVILGKDYNFSVLTSKSPLLKSSGKPIVGIGYAALAYGSGVGGYYTKNGGSMGITSKSGTKTFEADLFSTPNAIAGNEVQVLQNPASLQTYYMGSMSDQQAHNIVNWLKYTDSYSFLYREGKELYFWGYSEDPNVWTDAGKQLFVNVIEQAKSGNKSNQPLVFNALPAKKVGDSPFAVTATTPSRLPVTYTSSNPSVATVSGNIITIVGEGNTTISAYAPASDVYKEVTVTQQLSVTKPTNNANLSNLTISSGTLTPIFAAGTTNYSASLYGGASSIDVTPTVADAGASVKVNGVTVVSGNARNVALTNGSNVINVAVTAQDGITTLNYTLNITVHPALQASITSQTNVACNGGANGSATVLASGGVAPYTYSWSPIGGIGATATGLSAGSYIVTVTDHVGQTKTASVAITEPTKLTLTFQVLGNVSCNGGSDGQVTVVAAGGAGGYTFAWSNGATTAGLAGLKAGTYSVIVTDANGCTATNDITITEPAKLAVSAFVDANVSCNGGNDGGATATVTGGTAPYTYSWSNGSTMASIGSSGFGGLSAGTYQVTVTDAKGCTATDVVTVSEPAALAATFTKTDATSIGGSEGSATVSVTGGSGNYTFSWAPYGGNAATATGLAAGTYTVSVKDANSCATSVNVTIEEPKEANVLAIKTKAASPIKGTSMVFEVTFDQSVGGLNIANFQATGIASATVSNVTQVDAKTYNVTVTLNAESGELGLSLVNDGNVNVTLLNLPFVGTEKYTIDNTPPTAPSIPNLLASSDSGESNEDNITNATSLSFEGTTDADAYVTLYFNGDKVAEVQANAAGEWLATVNNFIPTISYVSVTADAADALGNRSAESQKLQLTIDRIAPVMPIISSVTHDNGPSANDGITNDNTPTVKGITDAYAKVALIVNGMIDGSVKADENGNWEYTFQNALTDGIYTFAAIATDVAGNDSPIGNSYSLTVYTTKPATPAILAISQDTGESASDAVTADNALIFNGTAESETNVTLYVDGAKPVATSVPVTNGAWQFDITSIALTEGNHTAYVVAEDIAGNLSDASASFNFTIDRTAPTVVLASNSNASVNAAFAVEVSFSEDVYNLSADDFTVTNGTVSGIAATDKQNYSITILPAADGLVSVKLSEQKANDLAGNSNTASNLIERTFDGTRPEVVIATTAAPVVNAPFGIAVTFTENVSGFDASDLTIENGTVSNFAATSAMVYTATVNPTADGDVRVSVAENVAQDAVTNGNKPSNTVARLYDTVKPTVTLATNAPQKVNAAYTVEVTFSEPVSGFELSDVTVQNASVGNFTKASDAVYTLVVSPTTDGEVSLSVAANVAQDAATNGNEASASLTRMYDATKPTVAVTTTAANPTNAPFTANFNFSEEVLGFELADITLTNATASNFVKVDGQHYTALVTPVADGEVNVKLAAGVAADIATNQNEASATLSLIYDATAPAGYTVAINTNRVDVTNAADISLSVAGAEVGTTFAYTISSENGGTPVTGTAQVQQSAFNLNALDLSGLNDGNLTATLYLVDAAGNKGADATAQVIKITRDIVAVAVPEVIKVPIRTIYANVPMPAKVEVTYSTGAKEQLNVTWSQGSYNGLVAGPYELTGELVLAPMTTNITNKTAKVTVEVQPNKVPTALALNTTTFKPEATATDALGTFTTTDPDDNQFVYTLVAGQGDKDNALFEVIGDKVYLKSNKGLSGTTSLTFRVRSTDPYFNTIEQTFTLTKEKYAKPEDQLKIVNAFSPDGDGINDTWFIPELRFYNSVEIEVFDRSGVRLFHTTNPEQGWDGRDTNGVVRKGAFFYIVQVKDINMVKKGVVTILKK